MTLKDEVGLPTIEPTTTQTKSILGHIDRSQAYVYVVSDNRNFLQ